MNWEIQVAMHFVSLKGKCDEPSDILEMASKIIREATNSLEILAFLLPVAILNLRQFRVPTTYF
jgi:hypothetical protein